MKRSIIKIDQEKCIGCSLCVNACTQDALQMIDGKATLVSEQYCDGLGMCLPQCPVDAISITTDSNSEFDNERSNITLKDDSSASALRQWPVQLHLVREDAAFFKDSNLLIAADCVPFTYPNFHSKMLDKKSLVIACPKLDNTEIYIQKIANIIAKNDIRTITVAIMEVPCCSKLLRIVNEAISISKPVPLRTVVINLDGTIK